MAYMGLASGGTGHVLASLSAPLLASLLSHACFGSPPGWAAYTFYFLFITTGPCTKLWMFRGLLVILSYVIGTGVLTYLALGRVGLIEEQTGETYAEVMTEIGLEGAKCAANMVVLYHALLLYNAQPNDASTSAITSMMV